MATAARKNFPLMGRNFKQNQALGGRPSALTGLDRKRERERERETRRNKGKREREAQRQNS